MQFFGLHHRAKDFKGMSNKTSLPIKKAEQMFITKIKKKIKIESHEPEDIKSNKIQSSGSPSLRFLQFHANTSNDPLGKITLAWLCIPLMRCLYTKQNFC